MDSKERSRGRGRTAWDLPREVYLYRDPSSTTLRLEEVSSFLREIHGLHCEVRDEFFVHHGGDLESLARAIAATRVRDLGRPFEPFEPAYGETKFEARLLEEPTKRVPAVLYDAYRYLAVMRDLLPRGEATLKTLHIAFGHRLLGTFGQDGRYHARTVVCGFPCVVSTSGLVEAPAKPEGYYKLKAQLAMAFRAIPFEAAKEPFQGQFLDYDDERLTEVAKGYALQCTMYHIAKEPFCDDGSCRLFNAHRQSEMLAAQVTSGRLCSEHASLSSRIREAMTGGGEREEARKSGRPTGRSS